MVVSAELVHQNKSQKGNRKKSKHSLPCLKDKVQVALMTDRTLQDLSLLQASGLWFPKVSPGVLVMTEHLREST